VWSDIEADSQRYEESYSNDGGKTWAGSFIAELTRESHPATAAMAAASADSDAQSADADKYGQRDFDFDFGAWKTHSSRLLHPLRGATTWAEIDRSTVVEKVWNGRANLAEYEADGPAGHVQLLSLRWFNPGIHKWNLDFATRAWGSWAFLAPADSRMAAVSSTTRKRSTGSTFWFGCRSGGRGLIPRNPNRHFPMMAGRPER
jgi:hypothetical protein